MRIRGAVLVAALLASASAPGVVRADTGGTPDATLGPLISGTSQYVNGTYVWTDYAYDDKGATYPSGESNAADLVQLQIGETPGGIHVRSVLETLTDPSLPVLRVAFDTDNDPSTGSPNVSSWQPKGSMGVDAFVKAESDGAVLYRFDGTSWGARGSFPVVVDAASNTIDFTIPRALLDPAGAIWRAFASLGLTNAAPSAVFDLAFVGGEQPTGWQSTIQSGVIAGTTDVQTSAATIDFRKIEEGTTELADANGPGFHSFLYRSNLNLPEGIPSWNLQGPNGAQLPLGNFYAGSYQPYIVYLPDRPLPEHPALVVYMHGLTQTHTSNANTLGKGLIDPDAVVVMPLGRGEDSFYEGPAEQDVLDVTDDAMRRFDVDPNHVVLAGISMGGFGAFRLGILHPDRWSAIVPLIGTANSAQFYFGQAAQPQIFSPGGFPSGAGEMMENLANDPIRMVNGQVDPIVNNAFVNGDTAALMNLNYDFRSWVLLRRQHEVVPQITNCVFTEALQHVRDPNPRHVAFATEPAMYVSDPTSGLHLAYDSAYWVSGVTARDSAQQEARIVADNLLRRDFTATTGYAASAGQNFTGGYDLCGPNPGVQTQDAWREIAAKTVSESAPSDENGFQIRMTNVSRARIDLARTGQDVNAPITLHITGDGVTSLELHAAWPGRVSISRDGQPFETIDPNDDVVTLTDDMSNTVLSSAVVDVTVDSHTYTITPAP